MDKLEVEMNEKTWESEVCREYLKKYGALVKKVDVQNLTPDVQLRIMLF